jgi:carboxymethylenebutenolidase
VVVLAHEGTLEILYRDYPMPTGAGFTTGYMSRPDRIGQYPVVVLLAGLSGITPAIKDLARRFARNGYSVLVPDTTRGTHPGYDATFAEKVHSYDETPDRRVRVDIDDAIDWAVIDSADWAADGPVGVVGVDIGGRFAINYAAHRPDRVAALCVAYPPLAGDEDRGLQVVDALEMLPMAVLGLFGADDTLVPAAGADEAQRLNAHGRWILYEGVGHDFLDDNSDGYHSGAASDATARILATLEATLKAYLPIR